MYIDKLKHFLNVGCLSFACVKTGYKYFSLSDPISYPHLSPRYKESFDVGADIFAKFSAFIKNSPNNACKVHSQPRHT